MGKRILGGAVAVFVLWSILDFIMHGMFLKSAYESTASLWRPMGEMKMGVLYISVFIAALPFRPYMAYWSAPRLSAPG